MESKLAELALRESNERYNLVAKATNDLIWDLDLETNEILWSESMTQILGYSLQEITGDYYWWLSKVHPDDATRVNYSLRKHLVDKNSTGRMNTASYAPTIPISLCTIGALRFMMKTIMPFE
jgi:PAS domain S-box-containing protein